MEKKLNHEEFFLKFLCPLQSFRATLLTLRLAVTISHHLHVFRNLQHCGMHINVQCT